MKLWTIGKGNQNKSLRITLHSTKDTQETKINLNKSLRISYLWLNQKDYGRLIGPRQSINTVKPGPSEHFTAMCNENVLLQRVKKNT